MRRVLLLTLLALVFPAAAHAASVKTVGCTPALDGAARGATFEARMKAVKGTERMQVRFTLQVRDDGETSWRRVAAAGFDTWLSSQAGVRRYSYSRTIQNLAAPAVYRTTVRFRWLDADGATLRSRRDTSAWCRQPDLRPDLEVTGVDVLPAPRADRRRYTVTVRNAGRTAAAAFDLGAAGRRRGARPAAGLRPRRRREPQRDGDRPGVHAGRRAAGDRRRRRGDRRARRGRQRARRRLLRRRSGSGEGISSRRMAEPAPAPAPPDTLRDRYRDAFRAWLARRDEQELGTAYALGREAVSTQASLLELAEEHHRCTQVALRDVDDPARRAELLEAAGTFFGEALSVFEITHRGYHEVQEVARLEHEHVTQLRVARRGVGEDQRRDEHRGGAAAHGRGRAAGARRPPRHDHRPRRRPLRARDQRRGARDRAGARARRRRRSA